ncbi:MAG: DoxX family protein [Hyphomicrobiaceae bacterium]
MIDQATSTGLGACALRLSLGALSLSHAALKAFVFTPAGTFGYFESLGLPGALGLVAIAVEAVAGLALIAGVGVRIAALATLPILIGAIVFVHGANGWLFTNSGGGWEFPALWAVALGVQALLGEGAFALKLSPRDQSPEPIPAR